MTSDFPVQREGGLRILAPLQPGGKVSSEMAAFYNPRMVPNRDIATLCAAAYSGTQQQPVSVCDLLSATGVRGLRFLGLDGVGEVYMNDVGRTPFDLMYRNLKLNYAPTSVKRSKGLITCVVDGKKVYISNQEALTFLAEHKHSFHILDLDPFGSPVAFIPSCIKSLRHGSMFCVTATDTAALCGTYPTTCVRRYDALPFKTEYRHEIGLRILTGYLVRRGCSIEVGMQPLFSHATAHYYRLYLAVKGSRRAADEGLEKMGWALHCFKCGSRQPANGFLPAQGVCCGVPMAVSGPLWLGPLKDEAFVSSMTHRMPFPGMGAEAAGIVSKVAQEADIFSFYDTHQFSRMLGVPAPSTSRLMEALRQRGFHASPTHITGTGLKSDAPASEIVRCIKELSKG